MRKVALLGDTVTGYCSIVYFLRTEVAAPMWLRLRQKTMYNYDISLSCSHPTQVMFDKYVRELIYSVFQRMN